MIIFNVLYILAALIYLYMGYVTLTNDSKSKINRIFFVICLIMFLWSLLYGASNSNAEVAVAIALRRYATITWSMIYSIILHFFITLTKRDHYLKKYPVLYLLLYLPAFFSLYLYYIHLPLGVEDIVRSSYGWVYVSQYRNGWLWENYLNVYYISNTILCMYLVLSWGIKSNVKREKSQARVIALTLLITVLISSVTDVVLPVLGTAVLPPITVIISLILVHGIRFTIIKYRFMDLNQENIILDLLKIIDEGLITLNHEDCIISANQGALRLLGYSVEMELIGKPIDVIFPRDMERTVIYDAKSRELTLLTKEEKKVPVILHSLTMWDNLGDVRGTLISFQDLTEIKEALKMKQFAYYDGLTNLPNRRLLDERLGRAIIDAERENKQIALLYIDIDYFKTINDSLGHSDGDEFLKQVSFRMAGIIRKADTLARIGGDEFILMMRNIDIHMIDDICIRMLDSFKEPFYINDKKLCVTASIGLAIYPFDGIDGETLIKNADIAMYQAKNNGKNKYELYNPDLMKQTFICLK